MLVGRTNRQAFIGGGPWRRARCASRPYATAQEGRLGIGHERWHQDFYAKLRRNDGTGPCCSLTDCRPTQSRMIGDHYEVKVDGKRVPVPSDKINNVVAPDRGAHVCVPRQIGSHKGELLLRHLPPEG